MSALPLKADIAVGKGSVLNEVPQAQFRLDNRQFELRSLQPCSCPVGIAAVIVGDSTLRGCYPVSCAVQVANGVMPRPGRARFFRVPSAALLAGMIALGCFPVAIVPLCGYSAASAARPCVSFGFNAQASPQLRTLKDFTNLPTPSVCAQSMPSSIISSSLKCFFSLS